MIELLKKYLNCEIKNEEFSSLFTTDSEINKFLNTLLPESKDINTTEWKNIGYKKSLAFNNFNVRLTIDMLGGFNSIRGKFNAYEMIFQIVKLMDINIENKNPYDKIYDFVIDNVPEYIGGDEAESYIEKIYNSIPEDLKGNQKKKLFKSKLKEAFKYKTIRPPVWIQEPEWPVNEEPLLFLKRENDGDLFKYYFYDKKTDTTKIVEQFA